MIAFSVYFVSFVQIASDITCVLASAKLSKSNKSQRLFFMINCIAFSILTMTDIYYNYVFRILKSDILLSARLINMSPHLILQLLLTYNWYNLLRQQSVKIFSWFNFPYLLFSGIVIVILTYFFISTDSLSGETATQDTLDIMSVVFDVSVWFFTIICLGRAKNNTLALLALGCLMIISADLTMTCLFMYEKTKLEFIEWPHIIWAVGALVTAIGFVKIKSEEKFTFYSPDSIHANCSWWLLISSLFAFLIGFIFTITFTDTDSEKVIHYALWDMPIALMFTMIAATLLSNRFSKIMLSPINSFSQSIESFKEGVRSEVEVKSDIREFRILGDFIDKSFTRITEQLDNNIKITAQVAHDIRSPLSALEIGIKSLPATLDESKRVLLRDAVLHIKDITNILEKDDSNNKLNEIMSPTQVAVLLDNVLSDRRLALVSKNVKINQIYESEAYGYFSIVVPSMLKRVLTNILNNSYEAISADPGIIDVNLSEENGYCVISVSDNGCGVATTDIPSLFNRGFSTKKDGSGLGLYHARETLAAWGASIELFSMDNGRTEVRVKVPLVAPPLWFVSKLSFIEDEIVVCVDDSISVYQGWQERFKLFGSSQKLIYCSSKESFLKELKHLRFKSATYLIDFEFSGNAYQGYDFTNLLLAIENPKNRIFMVTSRSGENEIQDYCLAQSIRIISKNFAVKIPLNLFDVGKRLIVLTSHGDGALNKLDSEKWHVYSNANDFISDMPYFENEFRIYVHKQVYNENIDAALKKYNLLAEVFESAIDLALIQ